MKVSTAKRRINKTIDELFTSLWDDFKDGYKRGYVDGYRHGLQGIEPKIAEAEKVYETERTESMYREWKEKDDERRFNQEV